MCGLPLSGLLSLDYDKILFILLLDWNIGNLTSPHSDMQLV